MFISLLSFVSCKDISNNKPTKKIILKKEITPKPVEKKELFLLNDKNAIPFFYEYEQKNKENLVRIITDYGKVTNLIISRVIRRSLK